MTTLLARKNRSNVQFVKQLLQPKTPWKHILIQFMMEKSWIPLVLSVQFVKKYSHPAVIFGLTFQTSTKMWWLKVTKSQKFFFSFLSYLKKKSFCQNLVAFLEKLNLKKLTDIDLRLLFWSLDEIKDKFLKFNHLYRKNERILCQSGGWGNK